MASNKLRGQSRRDFVKGALAVGAALGWGPSRTLDFIARGGGEALAADCSTSRVQNLVVLLGAQGANGYPMLLWPHHDNFTPGRFAMPQSMTLPAHFLQNTAGGGTPTSFSGALANVIDYNNPPAMASQGPNLGSWAAGERFKYVFGVNNQAFRGYQSPNAQSQGYDQAYWGSSPIPSNVGADQTKNFVVVSRDTPWYAKYGPSKLMTVMDGGVINPFHVNGAHNAWINYAKNWSLMGAAAAVQVARPTITPVMLVGDMTTTTPIPGESQYGQVPGAPLPDTVSSYLGMVDLFNSNAARVGGMLTNPQNATLFQAYTLGMLGASKTATLPTFQAGYGAAKQSANLVGLNLANQLMPTVADQQRYGFTGSAPAKLQELRDRLIVTAKALKLGLTAQVTLTYGGDDPHGLFTSMGVGGVNAATAGAFFRNVLNAFMDDLMSVPDPMCPGTPLGNNTVIVFCGDVGRNGVNNNNWNDPSCGGQGRMYVLGNGLLRTGFFGGDRAQFPGQGATSNDANARGPGEGGLYNPNTGDLLPFDLTGSTGAIGGVDKRTAYGEMACAAALYAVCGGNLRTVNNYYSGVPFPALINEIQTG